MSVEHIDDGITYKAKKERKIVRYHTLVDWIKEEERSQEQEGKEGGKCSTKRREVQSMGRLLPAIGLRRKARRKARDMTE